MKYYKLHLIRHGLTEGNLQGRYSGSGRDLPLCAEGRAQLKTLKKDFDYPQVPLVFTSPLRRATETAELLFPGVRQIELEDLREMAFGKFEGRAVRELVSDPEFAQWMAPTSRTVPEGAEDRQMFFNRTLLHPGLLSSNGEHRNNVVLPLPIRCVFHVELRVFATLDFPQWQG